MSKIKQQKGYGTAPVFMAAISTILGAILFLRFGYAVGHVGFWGTIAIIIIGHIVTIPTAMAVAEIATNQKVEGGGAYYIISRSFGLNIGAAIGIALFLAQAISVAFYVVAFAEAFDPIIDWLLNDFGILIYDKRIISIPSMALLTLLFLTKGADVGVKALYVVVAILFISILMFFTGSTGYEYTSESFTWKGIPDGDNFFYVFTIIFPAFTGIAAGLGLSGDLENPKKSIPLGTMLATGLGMIVYVAIAYKLTISASQEDLAYDQLIMSKIASWGPIIPIGLAAATISSALGSIMVAPRTLQALGADRIFPANAMNFWFSREKKKEPLNASVITCIIAFFFVLIGDVNFVAEIISMFFMVTYGAICTISFFEHFAADPSYRPTFKSKWYLSLIGAVFCFYLMFKMNALYAFLSLMLMVGIYIWITFNKKKDNEGLAAIFQGVIFQLSRRLQVFLQKSANYDQNEKWRPSIVCISSDTFERNSAFNLLRWISHKYGFGTYIHFIEGYLSKDTNQESKEALQRLIKFAETSKSNVYLKTLISPSYTSAIAQVIQLPGVSGKDNNMLLFEYPKDKKEKLSDVIDNMQLLKSTEFDTCILGTSVKGFGYNNEIHIWITANDFENANLMILMGYIILGHPEWKKGSIKILSISKSEDVREQRNRLTRLVESGRLPISVNNIEIIPQKEGTETKTVINTHSKDADLTIIGFRSEVVKRKGQDVFSNYDSIGNILFVNTNKEKDIS